MSNALIATPAALSLQVVPTGGDYPLATCAPPFAFSKVILSGQLSPAASTPMTATIVEKATPESITLSRRLTQGPVALPEALRNATLLAEVLRQTHDAGRTCGTLTPDRILLSGSNLELAGPAETAAVTPYTAPEVLQGRTPDHRSDIFAFGAIVYEMITGRRAFAGDNADALAVSLTISVPPPTRHPGIDHLIGNCLAKDPAQRPPRMQKVILELKLLTFGSQQAELPTRQQTATAALRAETAQLGDQIAALGESHNTALAELHRSTLASANELRNQIDSLQSALAAAEERAARAERELAESRQALASQIEQVQRDVRAMDQRLFTGENKLDVLNQGMTVLQEYSASRMKEFEQALYSQNAEIAVISSSQAQTDDLVEGVVAAMELLQASVFEESAAE